MKKANLISLIFCLLCLAATMRSYLTTKGISDLMNQQREQHRHEIDIYQRQVDTAEYRAEQAEAELYRMKKGIPNP